MGAALYYLSLAVIVWTAIVIAMHPQIPGGFVGALCMGGVAVFGAAGLGHDEPPTWVIGLVASLAAGCVWAGTRWCMSARSRGRAWHP